MQAILRMAAGQLALSSGGWKLWVGSKVVAVGVMRSVWIMDIF